MCRMAWYDIPYMKSVIIILATIVVVAILAFVWSAYVRGGLAQTQFDIIRKTCARHKVRQVALFRDGFGNIAYFQIPAIPGSDERYALYDMVGDEVAADGGISPSPEQGQKFQSLVSGLQAPITVDCDRLQDAGIGIRPMLYMPRPEQAGNALNQHFYEGSLIYASRIDIPEMSTGEARKTLEIGGPILVIFGSTDRPGSPTTYLETRQGKDSFIFQRFGSQSAPFTDRYAVRSLVYAYDREKGDQSGVIVFYINIASPENPAKIRLAPVRIGTVSKAQWNDLTGVLEGLKGAGSAPAFSWKTDDGLDR